MKIKEAFKKIETCNEIMELTGEDRYAIWFGDIICDPITDGRKFASYEEFRKYVRKEYFKDVADAILGADDWKLNDNKVIITCDHHAMTFELYVTAA